MRLGIDMDGVVYPWHEEVYRWFQENRGYEKDIKEFWEHGNELIKEWHLEIPFLYNSTTPRQDVLEYLPKLAELGEIYYITARPTSVWQTTRKFFDFYDLPFKENLLYERNKAGRVRLLGLDYFVDDMPHHVDSLLGITDVYLFHCIHNREQREGYKTVASLKEFYEIVASRRY